MMAYHNDFVLAVIYKGKVLRETNGTVYLPYGSEYIIRLKNKHSRTAVADVSIDGTSISQGGFIVPAHSSIDLERFVVDGNIITCGGAMAAFDLTLDLIAAHHGEAHRMEVEALFCSRVMRR